MKRFQRILAYCPDEISSVRVMNWCRAIAEHAEPEGTTLVRVLDDFLPEFPAETTEEDFMESEKQTLETEVSQILSELDTESQILLGDPLKNLLSELSKGIYDLVVVPAHDAESRSIAERLARKSPVGVLLLPSEAEPHFNKILLPVDFSEISKLALEWATAFSTLSESEPELTALHIMCMPGNSRAMKMMEPEALRSVIRNSSIDELHSFIRENAKEPKDWKLLVAENPLAGAEIVAQAKKAESDLIVVGAHGKNALTIALLGGVVTEVIRQADRSTLIVKRKNQSLDFLRNLLGLSN